MAWFIRSSQSSRTTTDELFLQWFAFLSALFAAWLCWCEYLTLHNRPEYFDRSSNRRSRTSRNRKNRNRSSRYSGSNSSRSSSSSSSSSLRDLFSLFSLGIGHSNGNNNHNNHNGSAYRWTRPGVLGGSSLNESSGSRRMDVGSDDPRKLMQWNKRLSLAYVCTLGLCIASVSLNSILPFQRSLRHYRMRVSVNNNNNHHHTIVLCDALINFLLVLFIGINRLLLTAYFMNRSRILSTFAPTSYLRRSRLLLLISTLSVVFWSLIMILLVGNEPRSNYAHSGHQFGCTIYRCPLALGCRDQSTFNLSYFNNPLIFSLSVLLFGMLEVACVSGWTLLFTSELRVYIAKSSASLSEDGATVMPPSPRTIHSGFRGSFQAFHYSSHDSRPLSAVAEEPPDPLAPPPAPPSAPSAPSSSNNRASAVISSVYATSSSPRGLRLLNQRMTNHSNKKELYQRPQFSPLPRIPDLTGEAQARFDFVKAYYRVLYLQGASALLSCMVYLCISLVIPQPYNDQSDDGRRTKSSKNSTSVIILSVLFILHCLMLMLCFFFINPKGSLLLRPCLKLFHLSSAYLVKPYVLFANDLELLRVEQASKFSERANRMINEDDDHPRQCDDELGGHFSSDHPKTKANNQIPGYQVLSVADTDELPTRPSDIAGSNLMFDESSNNAASQSELMKERRNRDDDLDGVNDDDDGIQIDEHNDDIIDNDYSNKIQRILQLEWQRILDAKLVEKGMNPRLYWICWRLASLNDFLCFTDILGDGTGVYASNLSPHYCYSLDDEWSVFLQRSVHSECSMRDCRKKRDDCMAMYCRLCYDRSMSEEDSILIEDSHNMNNDNTNEPSKNQRIHRIDHDYHHQTASEVELKVEEEHSDIVHFRAPPKFGVLSRFHHTSQNSNNLTKDGRRKLGSDSATEILVPQCSSDSGSLTSPSLSQSTNHAVKHGLSLRTPALPMIHDTSERSSTEAGSVNNEEMIHSTDRKGESTDPSWIDDDNDDDVDEHHLKDDEDSKSGGISTTMESDVSDPRMQVRMESSFESIDNSEDGCAGDVSSFSLSLD